MANYLDSQAEYDREYDPTYRVPHTERYLKWYEEESKAVRRELPCSLDLRFGPGRDEVLDFFLAPAPDSPVFVFIHGGYWQAFSSKEFSFVARGLHAHGITVVVTNYSLCPGVTIADITRQTRAAIAWIYRAAPTFHGDPRRIFVAGHSAGGQQVGMLLATRWAEEYGLPQDVIKGALTISGIFQLGPLSHCSMQATLLLTPELILDESPQFHIPEAGPPLLVSLGGDESPEFHRQSVDYLKAWQAKQLPGELLIQSGRNHFSALTDLSDANSQLCGAIVAAIARAGGAVSAPTRQPALATSIHPVPRGGALPTSFAQQRLWFLAQLFPDSYVYNEPIMLRLDELADPAVLSDCLTEITRRHQAWRTVFSAAEGVPYQQIEPARPFPLEVVDLRSLPPVAREPELYRIAVEHARRPFALREGPLVRALLVLTDDQESYLVVTAHHIVVDGVSFFSVFLPELSALYVAFNRKEPSPLPESALQYADFAAWQRDWLSEAELAPRLAYWRAHLANLTDLPLPIDFQRPPELIGRGARVPIELSAELTQKLRELGHGAGVSLFTTLLAAWKTLLYRYTGQGDIVVGSAAAGRPRPELEGVIGFFSNILVLRTKLDGSLTFRELLGKVGQVLAEARAHQDVPFDRLVAELGASRGPYENPIYNNTFLLMPPMPRLELTPGWRVRRFDTGVAKVDLYLELHQVPEGLAGHIEYRTELFAATTIAQLTGNWQTLLASIADHPTQRLAALPLLTAAEQRTLARFSGPAAPPLADAEVVSLEQLFTAQAARTPAAIALEHGAIRVSYAELAARTNQLAHYLQAQGVGPESLVGLCIERSVDAIVGILGVLKAGGAYVPLDPSYPADRLRFMLQDAALPILLTNRRNVGVLPEHPGRTVLLDADWPAIATYSAEDLAPGAAAQHLAYVIYTSGSTGQPKGVLVERRGLYYLAKAQEKLFGLGVGSRILQFFSISFDGSVWDFTLAWPVGATLVLASPEAILPGLPLAEFLAQHNIHAVMVTPSALRVTPYRELLALHTLISAGEALPAELVDEWAPGRRFFNVCAPTETTVVSIVAQCRAGAGKPVLGRPFDTVPVYVLDGQLNPLPIGAPGELYIGGPGVARGYLGRPELTAERFLVSRFAETAGTRLYKTGDRVKWLPDGNLDYLGRMDRQVKLRGFRIELGEIEAVLEQHPAIQQAKVVLEELPGKDSRIVAYVVPRLRDSPGQLLAAARTFMQSKLPAYMVPSALILLTEIPLLPSGKVNFQALPRSDAESPRPEHEAPPLRAAPAFTAAAESVPEIITVIWREILGLAVIALDDAFFDIGGHSLALARVQAKLASRLGVVVDILTLMRLPTVRKLSAYLGEAGSAKLRAVAASSPAVATGRAPGAASADSIAIVGMATRAPGVHGPDELWEVVRSGQKTIRTLALEELIAAGADPARVRRPDFIRAEGVLERADYFDAAFFGYSERDAAWMDPQRRQFLECAYEALEHAGCDPARFPGRIGVFAGCGAPLHWLGPVRSALRTADNDHERLRAQTLNGADILATGVAFKLGLRGPAVTVQTACSTSLTAVHLARQSLLAGECELVLAGGSSISSLREAEQGYLGAAQGFMSPDGNCRPFDAEASGMVRASGSAIVVLKRLADALADGDTIYALVIGSAMNNDGADKLGFTTPSENGITAVVEQAYAGAGIDPRSVGFVEAHGTGTRLGDSTEVRALTRAFARWTEQKNFCALGSLKGNLGHLDTAAGAAGVIKAALALLHELIPPQAGFRTPNPLLELPRTPFFVNPTPLPWPRTPTPRRAAVDALGIGGTNVHVVLEEAPPAPAVGPSRPAALFCLSARTATALAATARRLGDHLEKHPAVNLADVANTLAVGRTAHEYRATLVSHDHEAAVTALAAIAALGATLPKESIVSAKAGSDRPVVFLFPGQGTHYVRMGIEVYAADPEFRAEVDQCFAIAQQVAGLTLGALWRGESPDGARQIDEFPYAQTLLFTLEYALARRFLAWGIKPAALLGHSLGEYVAACIAGVFSVGDTLALLALRGRLMESTLPGSLLVTFAEAPELAPYLGQGVSVATYAPGSVVLTGLVADVEATRRRLEDAGIETSAVRITRAAHSPVMQRIRSAFREHVAALPLRAPSIPIISNLTGRVMTAEQATSPDAWADHLCSPVQLAEGLGAVLELGAPICLELGFGSSLGSALKQHRWFAAAGADVTGTQPDYRKRAESSYEFLLRGLGRVWELGVAVDWSAFYAHQGRHRVPLPTYPFEGQKFSLAAAPNIKTVVKTVVETVVDSVVPEAATARAPGERRVPAPDHPGDEAAQLVKNLWTRLLGTSALPAATSFFELGGDSLLAVQLLAELQSQTGHQIKLRQFMAQPTVDGMAALLQKTLADAPVPAILPADAAAETPDERSVPDCLLPLPPDPKTGAPDQGLHESAEASVHAFLRQYVEPMNARDGKTLIDEHWVDSEQCSLISAHDDILLGAANIKDGYLRSFAALLDVQVRIHDEHVVVFAGGQAASVTFLLDSDLIYVEGNQQVSPRNMRVSLSLEKHARGWRIVTAHYSVKLKPLRAAPSRA